MKYLVIWYVIKLVAISCPMPIAPKDSTDEFGRIVPPSAKERNRYDMELWAREEQECFRSDTIRNQRFFMNIDSAKAFMKRGILDSARTRNNHQWLSDNQLINFKLRKL